MSPKFTTQKDVARHAGVSQAAVTAVLRNDATIKIAKQTQKRIRESARSLGYQPNRSAQIMRTGRSGIVPFLTTGGVVQIKFDFLYHATAALANFGLQIQIVNTQSHGNSVEEAWNGAIGWQPEGVIMEGALLPITKEFLQSLRHATFPVVSMGSMLHPKVPLVSADYAGGFHRMTALLIASGYRSVWLMHQLGIPEPQAKYYGWRISSRQLGFRRAVMESGLPAESFREVALSESGSMLDPCQPGRKIVLQILDSNTPLPEVMFFTNDLAALGAMTACAERGIRIPEDLAIVGCNGEISAHYGNVPLTTLIQPTRAIAERSVELIVNRRAGGQRSKESPHILPFTIFAGASARIDSSDGVALSYGDHLQQ